MLKSTYQFVPDEFVKKKNSVITITLVNHWYLNKVQKTCPSYAHIQQTINRALIFAL